MPRLTEQEQQDIIRFIEADKPLPDEKHQGVFHDVAAIAVNPHIQSPPDKGGQGGLHGGHIPYNPSLTEKARENRKTPTPAENKLWFEVLQDKRFAGLKFTRQKPLDEYIVDFCCAELTLAIEVDGDSHAEHPDYDRQRTARLSNLGIEVIRYANRDIMRNLSGVYEDLLRRVMGKREQIP